MRNRKSSIGSTLLMAIAVLFMTGASAFAQQEKILHSFTNNGRDGYVAYGGLIFDSTGNLYGTTYEGGAYGDPINNLAGVVFELSPKVGGGWTEKILHNFNPNGKDGYNPYSGLVFDGSGNLYGTTYEGGTYGGGIAFELTQTTGGAWTERIIHNFGVSGEDGLNPHASLILDIAGNLYGTTFYGGSNNSGTVFELMHKAGGGWTEKILHAFNNNGTDGALPYASLIFDGLGNLYGTTVEGGPSNCGIVFELSPGASGAWTEPILHNFINDGVDGCVPYSSLIFDRAGSLYGTTAVGGSGLSGTAFELTPTAGGIWTEKALHNFTNNGTDGIIPNAGLIFDRDGNLYGTTQQGGTHRGGTLYELRPGAGGVWTERIVHNFSSTLTDGYLPYDTPVFDSFGNLYGTTALSSGIGSGTVFEITR